MHCNVYFYSVIVLLIFCFTYSALLLYRVVPVQYKLEAKISQYQRYIQHNLCKTFCLLFELLGVYYSYIT